MFELIDQQRARHDEYDCSHQHDLCVQVQFFRRPLVVEESFEDPRPDVLE